MIFLSILAFIFGIGLIILVHEAGHFYFAKRAGILCHEFSIGFGPAIWKKKYGETTVVIRCIPIGGYVAMADSTLEELMISKGDTIGINLEEGFVKELILDTTMDSEITGVVERIDLLGKHGEQLEVELEVEGEIKTYPVASDATMIASPKDKQQITPYERSFESKSIKHRAFTMGAGVVMNFILAIAIYLIISFITGVPNLESSAIGEVSKGLPAEKLGLKAGDEIKAIKYGDNDFKDINTWTEFSSSLGEMAQSGYTELTLKYVRDGKEYTTDSTQTYFEAQNIGITNVEIPDKYLNLDSNPEYGVQIGNMKLKYGTSSKNEMDLAKDEPELTPGDFITGISVYKYTDDYNKNPKEFESVNSWSDMVEELNTLNGDVGYVLFEFYDQETKEIQTSQTPAYTYSNVLLEGQEIPVYRSYIGVTSSYHFSLFGCISQAFENFWSSATVIFKTLKELISPSASIREVGPSDLSGFVGIFDMVKMTVSAGLLSYLSLLALLSVNIGIMNLLPIPALDGGRLVFLGYEAITRKKPDKKFETILNNIVMILLLLLFVYVTYNDIIRIFTK